MICTMSKFLSKCSIDALYEAAQSLKEGSLVAFPTETVYGLGADATNGKAVARIYEVKGRPANHPLIVHIADLKYLEQWISDIPEYAVELARAFWPGPMTLILRRSDLAKDFITGGQNTVGIRIPDNSVALELLDAVHKLGSPGIAAPSANRFGQVSPTTAAAVQDELQDYLADSDSIIDGGFSAVGLESTIIDCTRDIPKILRPGAVTKVMIEEVTGLKLDSASEHLDNLKDHRIRVSGSLENHYAPKAKIILDKNPVPQNGFIALKKNKTPQGVIRLAEPRTIQEYAQILYEALREGDRQNLDAIYVFQPTGDGLAVAIRDRLARSAKGR
jgi:L-threonylcarbamoyladenylate synthase